ncbi:MAG: LamG-like jellyroll fold domain-containing protein [Thermoguttaceae bacterium]|nr:LamG-like jellyroll fold domain-containing protein [Thermoguttaceae bacterium]
MANVDQERIWELAERACEGSLTADERSVLEGLLASCPEARRTFLHYLHLHGELYWQLGGVPSKAGLTRDASPRPMKESVAPIPHKFRSRLPLVAGVVTVGLILIGLGGWATNLFPWRKSEDGGPAVIARVLDRWQLSAQADSLAGSQRTVELPVDLRPGSVLRLSEEVVRFSLGSAVTGVLEGPAVLALEGADHLRLDRGVLTVAVGEDKVAGIRIGTPLGEVADLGTRFGVWTDGSGFEVHVFDGLARFRPREGLHLGGGHDIFPRERRIAAGEALRLVKLGAKVSLEGGKAQPGRFLHPNGGAAGVARWRQAILPEPSLAHLWSFEGWDRRVKLRDARGPLHLSEVVMFGGGGESGPDYFLQGADPSSRAVMVSRGNEFGNSRGVAFQTGEVFSPGEALTLEAIVRFDRPSSPSLEDLCVLIGTRQDARRCGFLLLADGFGQLGVTFDADLPWLELPLRMISGQWYFLAVVYRLEVRNGQAGTRVDAYCASLGDVSSGLTSIVKSAWTPGWIPAGHLGVGKGFEKNGAHAYPWAGAMDEIAIFHQALSEAEIARHFSALVGQVAGP